MNLYILCNFSVNLYNELIFEKFICNHGHISLQKNIVISSNPSSPLLDLYDMLDDETLEKKQDEAFDSTMQDILNTIKNVSKQ